MVGPPMSICSIASAKETSGFAIVFQMDIGLHTKSI